MRKVQRSEIMDFVTYGEARDTIRKEAIAAKDARRIRVGDALTFLFENPVTVRYQVLEMVRAEQIVKEADIQHELDTYNELLGDDSELGATLLIELDDPAERQVKLREWLDLPSHLYVLLENGERVRARFDPRQVGDDRVSSVQFLKFKTGGHVPVAIGCDLPTLTDETRLTVEQKAALGRDLADGKREA